LPIELNVALGDRRRFKKARSLARLHIADEAGDIIGNEPSDRRSRVHGSDHFAVLI
jgi:hypothetical protein